MGRTTLLVSRRSPFPQNLLNFFLERGDTLFCASPPPETEGPGEGYRQLPWNPRSPISAGNILLTLENESIVLDEVYLLHRHGEESRPLHQVAGSIIDESVDSALRGSLFICKEILKTFNLHGSGALTLILAGYPSALRPSLEAAMEGAFRELGSALFQVYRESGIRVRGYEDHREDSIQFFHELTELFAEENEKSWGRWNRPAEKGGLFSYFNR